mmetsp:Transcript_89580/g.149651  ORF Transcript_89580/g.149651 Transcript_89580/m.149651 type:complete len:88 (-) Transcript_89580:604-867(-)
MPESMLQADCWADVGFMSRQQLQSPNHTKQHHECETRRNMELGTNLCSIRGLYAASPLHCPTPECKFLNELLNNMAIPLPRHPTRGT